MTSEEQVKYLANIMSVAASDGTVTPREGEALRLVIGRLGVTAEVAETARNLVTRGDYKLQLLASKLDRIRNVEDMVLVALADGMLARGEARPIEHMTEVLGIPQREMDAIVARAQDSIRAGLPAGPAAAPATARPGKPPPLPANAAPPLPAERRQAWPPRPTTHRPFGSGSALAEKRARDAKAPARPTEPAPDSPPKKQADAEPRPEPPPAAEAPAMFQIPREGIVIMVQAAHADSLGPARTELESAAESGECADEDGAGFFAAWSKDRVAAAAAFALKVHREPRRRVYVDGAEVPWDEMFAFCPCAHRREAGADDASYCLGLADEALNVWGCREVGMPWTASADWWTLGAFSGQDAFVFDKEAIRSRLDNALARVRHCPFLDLEFAEAAMHRLPDKVKARGHWRFREASADVSVAEVRDVRRDVAGCSFISRAPVDAIVPADRAEAIRLIRLTARDLGTLRDMRRVLRATTGPGAVHAEPR